jgi:hypothetical protein
MRCIYITSSAYDTPPLEPFDSLRCSISCKHFDCCHITMEHTHMTSFARNLLLTNIFYFSRTERTLGHLKSSPVPKVLLGILRSYTHVANLREHCDIPGKNKLPNAI